MFLGKEGNDYCLHPEETTPSQQDYCLIWWRMREAYEVPHIAAVFIPHGISCKSVWGIPLNPGEPLSLTWERYPNLTKAVKRTHEEAEREFNVQAFHCHDFFHAFRVSNWAEQIAPDPETARKAGVAGLLHNDDRILQVNLRLGFAGKVPEKLRVQMMNGWLDAEPVGTFLPEERAEIIDAVLKHSNRNGPNDSLVLITLMDADRLVNLEADCIIRNGQYFGNSLRVVDPVYLLDDPKATFRDPRSILRTMPERFDWEKEGGFVGLRLPKAREFAKRRFAFWRLFIQETIEQIKESGAVPFPDFES